jgi:hypothetical protein
MDADGRPQAVTTWTSLLKHNSTEYSFKAFIDLFYHPVVSMLSGRPEPRINDEFQRILHLSDNTKIGDWYLYQKHSENRVYGCELEPYKLPKYVPVRIFSLEYIRQIMNSDDIHSVSLKKKKQLRIKGQIGSFICNSRGVREEDDRMLKEMKFFMSLDRIHLCLSRRYLPKSSSCTPKGPRQSQFLVRLENQEPCLP